MITKTIKLGVYGCIIAAAVVYARSKQVMWIGKWLHNFYYKFVYNYKS
jgi:hypothetical protein